MIQCGINFFDKFFPCVVDVLVVTSEFSYVFSKDQVEIAQDSSFLGISFWVYCC